MSTTTPPATATADPAPRPHASRLPVWLTAIAELTDLARELVDRAVRELGPAQRRSPEFAAAALQVTQAATAVVRDMRRIDAALSGYSSPAGIPPPLAELVEAVRPIAAIADAYDDNGLDEARPEWGHNHLQPEAIELLTTGSGRTLLTLADALRTRTALARAGGAS